jgi:hypothetical protein
MDHDKDAIEFMFNIDSTTPAGFTKTEIRNAVLLRVDTSGNTLDTVETAYKPDYVNMVAVTLTIRSGATKVNDYRNPYQYRVYNLWPRIDFTVKDIHVTGHFSGSCCKCYANDGITFSINGIQYDRSSLPLVINKK